MKEFNFYENLTNFLENMGKENFEREFKILSEIFREREEFMVAYKSKSVFKHISALDFSYLPPILKGRDDVMRSLIFDFRRILEEKETPSINYLLLGKGGTGKTLVAKYFGKTFRAIANEKNVNVFVEYFNCIIFNSKSKIIRTILAKYTHTSGRGLSDDEALRLILSKLRREQGYMLLIIDEVHLLKSEEILAFLNIAETFGHQNAKLSIILVSRSRDWMRVETERILSRINEKVKLTPYNFEEALNVLKNRCKLAFKENVIDDTMLTMVSQIVNEHKNMHHGIEILRISGLLADKEGLDKIRADLIREASDNVYPTFRSYIIDQLKDHELLTLYGIVKSLIDRDEPYTIVDYAFEEYQTICETCSIEPYTKMSFRKYVRNLNQLKIIYTKMIRIEDEERGRHLEIYLLDIPAPKLEERLFGILETKFLL